MGGGFVDSLATFMQLICFVCWFVVYPGLSDSGSVVRALSALLLVLFCFFAFYVGLFCVRARVGRAGATHWQNSFVAGDGAAAVAALRARLEGHGGHEKGCYGVHLDAKSPGFFVLSMLEAHRPDAKQVPHKMTSAYFPQRAIIRTLVYELVDFIVDLK